MQSTLLFEVLRLHSSLAVQHWPATRAPWGVVVASDLVMHLPSNVLLLDPSRANALNGGSERGGEGGGEARGERGDRVGDGEGGGGGEGGGINK